MSIKSKTTKSAVALTPAGSALFVQTGPASASSSAPYTGDGHTNNTHAV
ncbi:hypothetical protein ABIA33_002481 [Streptacidiphilus sp. MAP12-16]